ncbi:tRNA 5-methoxyuridine(34)/uridine 5-oxyacetic acid(34) synthase CmoB [Desulfobotulus sp. H1]|uniref:tRNA 5-methoxyuridine(34)/uridine 5-oxyacetic acid(34) synthase CmoB n=1 Tax=Desulfobotulus pelophilus TaxID=2823377 RepID=A0ABT3NC11_9BACT|nr:tRNA 5-methoxyuridine(34)/uridine 5-oxyacetic acid(34) synthase CmoB [Desulfobotulus pelophilus]MCW7754711.1 tRNA 5-methoxyuridine(34)/uridine 5-oxyacetic acid(34) synthase CmoB [Desulfobotulus pelophilus]
MRRLMLEAGRLGLTEAASGFLGLVTDCEARLGSSDLQARMLREAFDSLPDVIPSIVELDRDCICIGRAEDFTKEQALNFYDVLRGLIPWRKGPFSLFGVDVDTEWVSSMKWQRLCPFMPELQGRRILDIGSSNGYYLFRMAGKKPAFALGVEPFLPYYYQFQLVQQYARHPDLFMFPSVFEALPDMGPFFDVVFCMGVLYHRKSPVTFLQDVRARMKKGSDLVLETMIIEGDEPVSLTPLGRYAKMRSIYYLPTVSCLSRWLGHAGFSDVRCVDADFTGTEEQRRTAWSFDESLEDFLDPENRFRTVEGEPAPLRAVVLARAC